METVILTRNGIDKQWPLKDVKGLEKQGWVAPVAAQPVEAPVARPRISLGKKDD